VTEAPSTRAACPTCGQDAPVEVGGALELTLGSVAVLAEQRPVVACSEGHGATPEQAVAAAMEASDRSIHRARGRLLRGDVCGSCRAPLTMPARRATRVVTVEPPGGSIPVFTLRFDLPAVRCTECGVEQLPTRSQEDLVVAVPALFERGTAPGGS
jgi:hypothetical protein